MKQISPRPYWWGKSAIEWGLIAFGLTVASIALFLSMGDKLKARFDAMIAEINRPTISHSQSQK